MNELLTAAIDALRASVSAESLRWVEPHVYDAEDGASVAEFFGNGAQGSEPARLLMAFEDDGVSVWSWVTTQSLDFEEKDHMVNYREFLRANGWLG